MAAANIFTRTVLPVTASSTLTDSTLAAGWQMHKEYNMMST